MPSAVTWRSCMASSSAACVLAGARLTSSARTRLAKTGPGRKANSPVSRSSTTAPVMSAGSRSGVNWMRWKASPVTVASDRAVRVLATPGRSSSRTWPSASSPARTSSSTGRLPTRPARSRRGSPWLGPRSPRGSARRRCWSRRSQLLQLRRPAGRARAPRWCPPPAGPAPPRSPARAALGPRGRRARPRRPSRRGDGAVVVGPRRARCGRACRWRVGSDQGGDSARRRSPAWPGPRAPRPRQAWPASGRRAMGLQGACGAPPAARDRSRRAS